MIRKILLPVIFLLLAFTFWSSQNIQTIAAGVAILLFGMIFLDEGFKAFTGGPLEKILKKSTDKLYKSIGFGVVSTTLLQSSSLISVITISFISAGLIGLSEGIGIIFGANIGTTTGAWLIAIFGLKVKISTFALPMLVFGIILVFQKKRGLVGIGRVLAGLGFLFLGIHYMKEGFEAFEGSLDLTQYSMTGFVGLLVYAGFGIIATVIMQSSHATLALILTALAAGQISYENSLALAIGANIGTTITAIIGAIGANINGKKLAGAHLIFNLITGLIAITFINPLGSLVNIISSEMGISETDYTLKLSVFHTLFNLIGVAVMVPWTGKLVTFLNKTFKEKPAKDIDQPKFLSRAVLNYPQATFAALIKESKHLFDNAFEIIAHGLNLHREDILSDKKVKNVIVESKEVIPVNVDEVYYKKVKIIYGKIIEFASLAQSETLSSEKMIDLFDKIKTANRYVVEVIKNIKDIQPNMSKYVASNNTYMVEEYNFLRIKIAKILREIYRIQTIDIRTESKPKKFFEQYYKDRHEKLMKLDKKAIKSEVLASGRLDSLIRDRKINSKMATSLMNDNAIVIDICRKLVKVAELLYHYHDSIIQQDIDETIQANGEKGLVEEEIAA